MKQGARPLKRIPSRQFHDRYPDARGVTSVPDFNLDAGLQMPDQDADSAPSECTGYTPTDLLTDVFKKIFSPDWSYAMTLWLMGSTPTENGADPHAAMQVAILLGVLPKDDAPFNAKSMGELYCSNWRNWSSSPSVLASPFAQNGVLDALGNGDPLSSMAVASSTSKIGVSIVTQWYPEWENPLPGGILPMPAKLSDPTFPWHNYAYKGQKTFNGQPNGQLRTGIIKSWQGDKIGDGGFLYMPPDVAEAVLKQDGAGALIFDPAAVRVLSELKIIVERFFPILISSLPPSLKGLYVGSNA